MKEPGSKPISPEDLNDGTGNEDLEPWPEPEEISAPMPDVLPMTEDLIPGPLIPWAKDVAGRLQIPLDFTMIPLVIVLGSLIGTGIRIRPKQEDDWEVTPNLWGGPCSPPSALKTPALKEVVNKILGRLEAEAKDVFELAQTEYETDGLIKQATVKALKKTLDGLMEKALKAEESGKNEAKEAADQLREAKTNSDRPTLRRYKTNDSSIEKLVELLEENPRGLLYFRDELVGLFMRAERKGNEQDRAFLLESWDGDYHHTDDRIGRGTHSAEVCLSLLGSIQPDKLIDYLNRAVMAHDNDGLVQRLQLLVYPDLPTTWEYVDRRPNDTARKAVFNIAKALSEYENTSGFIRFDDQAQEVFIEWITDLEVNKLRGDDHDIMKEHLAKYRSLMPSLALIFYLASCASKGAFPAAVDRISAIIAVRWCEYLESHARRIYSLVLNSEFTSAARLAEKIREGRFSDGFKVRDVQLHNWTFLQTAEEIGAAIEILIEAGWLRIILAEEPEGKPGRPEAPTFDINPKIFEDA